MSEENKSEEQQKPREGSPQAEEEGEGLEMDVVVAGRMGLQQNESKLGLIGSRPKELSPISDDALMEALELPPEEEARRRKKWRRGGTSLDSLFKKVAVAMAGFTGEFVGTFLLTLVITTAVTVAAIADALCGIWQVGVLSGLGVALSIYISAHISDAHLNPAVTVSFAIIRYKVFSWKKIAVYIVAQMLGGFVAGGVLFGIYRHAISDFEDANNIERGQNGSERSAMVFGEYFPNPAVYGQNYGIVSSWECMLIEAFATGILVFVIFAFTDPQNTTVGSGEHKVPVPILIGATVMVLISLYGSITQAGINPARDFGPRLFAAMAGWGKIAIPGPRNGFWAYIIGPLIGGPIGGALYDLGASRAMRFKKHMKKRMSIHQQKPRFLQTT